MFGSKALALPPPFTHDHRTQQLYSEPARPQPAGQCHFRILHTNSKEQRCPCQGYQHNRTAPGNVCDCAHAACYHAHNIANDNMYQEMSVSNGSSSTGLSERIKKLEEALQMEREIRESILTRERQTREREIQVLREALTPFYQSEEDMQHKLAELEDRLNESVDEQTRMNARVKDIEDVNAMLNRRVQHPVTNGAAPPKQRTNPVSGGLNAQDASMAYSGSEDRTSASVEPASPRPSGHLVVDPESPRSSGILNLVELPRPALARHALPPHLSPPAEPDEPRSSGFLSLDVKELIQRRNLVVKPPPGQTYSPPSSSATKSPPTASGSSSLTPQSLPRVSPPTHYANGSSVDKEDRAHKKRKHQNDMMPLDVLANVSAASPIMP